MGFKDRLKGMLFEEDPTAPADVEPAGAGASAPVRTPTATVVASASGSDEEEVEKFLEVLRGATDDDRSPGHRAFWQKYQELDGLGMDEAMRYKAAAKTATGVTASDLLASIKAVQAELGKEQKEFEAMITDAESKEVDGTKAKVSQLSTEIAELEKKLGDLRSQHSSLSASIEISTKKFADKRRAFDTAVTKYRGELDQEAADITTHLGT